MDFKLSGLVAATHTPFHADGQLNLSAIEKQAEHIYRNDVHSVFVGGTTGESHSLTVDERLALAKRWKEVAAGSKLNLVVHVGGNCLADSRRLAEQAESIGASAIAAVAPSYFKPKNVEVLVECCAEIASAAPSLPFYYYDIPVLTGLSLSVPEFLARAPERIPTLTGVKFTNPDLMAYQECRHAAEVRFDMPWGVDECLLPALAVGATGAVGSTYNLAAPIYNRIIAAFKERDFEVARKEQYRAVQLIRLLAGIGFIGATKAVMGFLGVEVGPARLPNTVLTAEQQSTLRTSLERLGYFDWIRS